MSLPTRTIQKQHEAESYAVLLYALRKVGIFRNLTENDYGIDFEIELVVNGHVTGRYVKVQVKSAEDVRIRQSDNVPTISGINQSTLAYWTELSYSTNVIVYAVDLTTEAVYMTKPVFWQATGLLDGTDTSKTLEFIPCAKEHHKVAEILTSVYVVAPPIREQLSVHRSILRQLKAFLELYGDVFWLDAQCGPNKPDVFEEFLALSSELLWERNVGKEFTPEHMDDWAAVGHWANEHGELENYLCQIPMRVLMPLVLRELRAFRQTVLRGGLYWANKNMEYLKLVFKHDIPETTDHAAIQQMGQDYDKTVLQNDWEFFRHLAENVKQPSEVGVKQKTVTTK